MTMARAHLVDVSVTRWYHCVTRCVRRAFLLGEGPGTAKNGSNAGSRNLQISSPSPSAGSRSWTITCTCSCASTPTSPRLVRRRSRPALGKAVPTARQVPQAAAGLRRPGSSGASKTLAWVATARDAFAKPELVHEMLERTTVRLANRQDQTRGAFFEERFKSVAILDDESLLATCAYIDLNPVAAGIVEVPEASPHTSITTRVEHVESSGPNQRLESSRTWQRRRIECVGRPGGINLALPDRGSTTSWILHVKGCWKDSRWEATCSWSITPAGSSAKARP